MEDRVGRHPGRGFAGLRALGQHVGRPPVLLPLLRPAQSRRQGRGQEDLPRPYVRPQEDAEEAWRPVGPCASSGVPFSQQERLHICRWSPTSTKQTLHIEEETQSCRSQS